MKTVLWQSTRTVLRHADETEHDYAHRIEIIASTLMQAAYTAHAGRHPRVVVHFSASKTEAIVSCTVVW